MGKFNIKQLGNNFVKILLAIITIGTLMFSPLRLSANSIDSVTMDVFITENGDAQITEVWQADLTEGTEGYRSFSNMYPVTIKDFTVTDDSGTTYTYLDNWQTDTSFDEKKYKNGINYAGDETELCWGISKYGSRIYTLTYTLTDLVTQCTDAQVIYFDFLKLSQNVGNATIRIHSFIEFNAENTKIWAYGYQGEIIFDDTDAIVMNCQSSLSSFDYMTALIRFEEGTFATKHSNGRAFDDIYEEAMVGSDYQKNEGHNGEYLIDDNSFIPSLFNIALGSIVTVFTIIINILFFVGFFIMLLNKKARTWIFGSGIQDNALDFGDDGTTLPSLSNTDYWRDIPCDSDLFKAYWIAKNYLIASENTLREGLLGALLLKWVKDNKIVIDKSEKKGLFNFKDNNYEVDFLDFKNTGNDLEDWILGVLRQAAGNDEILERKEFEKWCRKNYYAVENWFDSIMPAVQSVYTEEGLLTSEDLQVQGAFGRTKTVTSFKVDPSLKDEALRLQGLKRFLLDFSIINKREYIEVHLWEYYLMFAQLLGIADKVAEQFSQLYPDFKEMTNIDLDTTYVWASSMAHSGYSAVEAGRASSSGSDGSSGGGGSSSSGGGSSSGGSSGGGFR